MAHEGYKGRGTYCLPPHIKHKLMQMYLSGEKLITIQYELGVSSSTINKYVNRWRKENGDIKFRGPSRADSQSCG
jgi:transposase